MTLCYEAEQNIVIDLRATDKSRYFAGKLTNQNWEYYKVNNDIYIFIFLQVYHLCEAEFHCFKGYSRLHFSDYYVSDLSVVTTIWSMTRIKPPNKHLVFLAVAILLQFAVTETFSSNYHFYINLILAGPALVYLICFHYVSTVSLCVGNNVQYFKLYKLKDCAHVRRDFREIRGEENPCMLWRLKLRERFM
jgi:hypothetical protein